MKYIKKLELRSRRLKLSDKHAPYRALMGEPGDVVRIARSLLEGEEQEVFLVFPLDAKNKVLGYEEVARGSVDMCPVDIRAVFRTSIHMGASAVILAHNHPSGEKIPSTEDMALTERLESAGNLLGLPVLDHVIVVDGDDNGYSSMAELGVIGTVKKVSDYEAVAANG